MNTHILARIISVAVIAVGLTGCETKPEDIEKWKANGNTAKLIKTLGDSRQFIRLDAIAALGELKAETAVAPLGTLLKDPDPVIVHESLDALAAIGTPAVEPFMLQAITFETGPARLTAATTLGTLKSEKAVDPLIVALHDEYENVTIAAAVSLGQIGDPSAIAALSETAHDGSVQLRNASITSIRSIGGEAAIQALAAEMGDISEIVRDQAVAGLIDAGDASEPIALESLRSANDYERESAVRILKGINKVPTTGNDAVWFQLSSLSIGETVTIHRQEARQLAAIDNGMEALIEAVAHPSEAIREHAFLALETIGEPAAQPLVSAADYASSEARAWFSNRSRWPGAPAGELDLWAAATALNPAFKMDRRHVKLLMGDSQATEDMLKSKQFKPDREVIPLLIEQMGVSQSADEKLVDNSERRRELAFKKLQEYKEISKFPLIAAVNDDDPYIAALSAQILIGFDDDDRTTQAVITSFANRLEAGENLSNTPFHDALLELDAPEVDALLLKVRPNAAEAIRTLETKFPGSHVSNIPVPPANKVIPVEPFRLKYMKNGKAKELKVIFRPDEEGNWVPNPPLPDELP
ncbi:HEAT repeat domain-containing protein [Pontiellaceae bacterium B1224]|nr:HEAT repeat domain-containing protein [Pontiellaceae bacterium B1224]